MDGTFQNKGSEAEERSHGSEHDRTKAPLGALHDRRPCQGAFPDSLIDEIDHDQGIVHDHPTQAEDTHERYGTQGYSQDPVTQDHSDEPEGDDGHDDERLCIGSEGDGEQREDQEHGNRKSAIQRIQGFELLLLFPSEAVCQVRVQGGQIREDRIGQDVVGFVA